MNTTSPYDNAEIARWVNDLAPNFVENFKLDALTHWEKIMPEEQMPEFDNLFGVATELIQSCEDYKELNMVGVYLAAVIFILYMRGQELGHGEGTAKKVWHSIGNIAMIAMSRENISKQVVEPTTDSMNLVLGTFMRSILEAKFIK